MLTYTTPKDFMALVVDANDNDGLGIDIDDDKVGLLLDSSNGALIVEAANVAELLAITERIRSAVSERLS